MKKIKCRKVVASTRKFIRKRAPELLSAVGIAGMITTTVLAVKVTPKAMKLIDDARAEKGDELTKSEVIKAAWKPYLPCFVTGLTSIGCIILADSVNFRQKTALATACQMSQAALADYTEKVVETIGDKKEKIIREKVSEEHLKKDPYSESSKEIFVTGKGSCRFYDAMGRRRFTSDIDTIKKAAFAISQDAFRGDGTATLNDFYSELHLETMPVGDAVTWDLNEVGRNGIEPTFDAFIDDDETPCIVVDFLVRPTYHERLL